MLRKTPEHRASRAAEPVETVHESLDAALSDAFDSAVAESHYTGEPAFWGIDYGDGRGWFSFITSRQERWATA